MGAFGKLQNREKKNYGAFQSTQIIVPRRDTCSHARIFPYVYQGLSVKRGRSKTSRTKSCRYMWMWCVGGMMVRGLFLYKVVVIYKPDVDVDVMCGAFFSWNPICFLSSPFDVYTVLWSGKKVTRSQAQPCIHINLSTILFSLGLVFPSRLG